MSGKIIVDIGNTYIIHPNRYEHKYLAEELYEKTFDECIADNVISKEDKLFEITLFKRKLPFNYKEQLKEKQADIEEKKVALYYAVNEKQEDEANRIRKEIDRVSNEVMGIFEILHSLDNMTAEGIAEIEKNKYLIRKSIKKRVSDKVIVSIMEWLSRNYIKEGEYRKLAKSGKFSNLINSKIKAFKNWPPTDEQLTLMHWYRFYTSVFSHQERPFEWVINDDLALDGWYIMQSRKLSRADSINYVESKTFSEGTRNAQELYVIAPKEMAATIDNANGPYKCSDSAFYREDQRKLTAANG